MSKFSADIARLSPNNALARKSIAREIADAIRGIDADPRLRPQTKAARLSEFDADLAALAALDADAAHTQRLSTTLDGSGASFYEGAEHAERHLGGASTVGRKGSPVLFDTADVKALHAAVANRGTFAITTKAASSIGANTPPEFAPGVLGPIHEPRLLDKLPSRPVDAPVLEYIQHQSTTGGPGVVAEMAVKPEATAVIAQLTAHVVKIAVHAGITWETLRDYDSFVSYFQTELMRQMYDQEAAQILSGSGTGGNLAGLTATSGILTHAIASSETPLDAVESSIATMRTGPALAVANLLILNPSDWSKIRRSKDNYGRYLTSADPTAAEANTLWGIEVFTTTAQAAGSGIMLDTTKFGEVLIRDSITVSTGTNNDDFSRNIQRFVIEERIGLAVTRPAAVLSITGF